MRLRGLTAALIGLSVLCWAGCASSRKATSSLQLTAYGLQETRDTVREQVMVAVHDTVREVTTITIDRNESGDTLRLTQETDRYRGREAQRLKDRSENVVVVRDTVYIEKRDSSLRVSSLGAYGLQGDPSTGSGRDTVSGKLSAVSKVLKWIFWILIGLIGLIITMKVCSLRR